MSTTGAAGVLSYGMQTAKGAVATTFYRHRAADVNYGPVQDLRTLPLEVGGIPTPTGAYKAGVFLAGGATLHPRLEGDFGWLLKGLMGAVATSPAGSLTQAAMVDDGSLTVTGTLTLIDPTPPATQKLALTVNAGLVGDAAISISGLNGTTPINEVVWLTAIGTILTQNLYTEVMSITVVNTAGTGTLDVGWYTDSPYVHQFKFDADGITLPWLTVRKFIPGSATLGEIGLDNKVTSVRFQIPQNGVVQARTDFVGREPSWAEAPAWSYADAFEGPDSIPVSCVVEGGVLFPVSGGELPIVNASVVMTNNCTTPAQEGIIGTPYPDDITPISRAMTIQALLKWNNPDMYQQILTNAAAGVAWDPAPYTTDFRIKVASSKVVSGTTKYLLQIDAQSVMWNMQQAPVLAGGDIVMLPLIGTVMAPASGEYCTIEITNAQVSYA
jgi:hypothetical protein